jgi:hypothetical protein
LTTKSCFAVKCLEENALSIEPEELGIDEISLLEAIELENTTFTHDCTDRYIYS